MESILTTAGASRCPAAFDPIGFCCGAGAGRPAYLPQFLPGGGSKIEQSAPAPSLNERHSSRLLTVWAPHCIKG